MARTTDLSDAVRPDQLAELAPGTAYVATVVVLGRQTYVTLEYPFRDRLTVRFSGTPTSEGNDQPAGQRALAVQVRIFPTGHQCTVLMTSATGARRVPITLMHALALAQAGSHTVFFTDRPQPAESMDTTSTQSKIHPRPGPPMPRHRRE